MYTLKDVMEHVVIKDRDVMIICIDGNRIAVVRNTSFGGASVGRYFRVILNGQTLCTRCTSVNGIKKALKILNSIKR